MAARVQIVVEAKDASSGVLRAITGQFGELGGLVEELTAKNVNWGNVAERAATMVIDALQDAVRVTQQYAQDVRDLALASGQSAEAASRMLMVLDDYQLTAEDAATATKALTREGLAPTIETLADISAEYLSLNDAQERNELLQKKLGRASKEWLNLMAQGPEKIRAMSAAVDKSLILTEENVRAAEEYRLAMDQWGDSVMALKIRVGNDLLPVLTDLLEAYAEGTAAIDEQTTWLGKQKAALSESAEAWKDLLGWEKQEAELSPAYLAARASAEAAVRANTEAMVDEAVAAKETTKYYNDLISSIQSAQAETDRYSSKTAELNAKKAELLQTIENLKTRGYREEGQTIQEERKKLAELDKQLADNAKAHEKWAAQTVFSFAQARAAADGEITKGEGEVLIAMGEQLDLFDQKTADTMRAVNEAFAELDVSDAKATVASLKDALVALTGKTWVIDINTDTSGVVIPNPSTSGGSCFIAGTKVLMGDGTEKNIENIQAGDVVTSYDFETGTQIRTSVTKTFVHSPAEMGSHYLLINNIGVTPEHLVYSGGWKGAGTLHVGDDLQGTKGEAVTVARIRAVYKRVRTYNLHVDHAAHNYYAGGVLVHNVKTEYQSGGAVYAGTPAWVGEAGPEPFFPSVNGRILSHSEALHAMTLGGGGGTNYFYGNVTIEAGSETGGDVMNIR